MTLITWMLLPNSLLTMKSDFLGKSCKKSLSMVFHNVSFFTIMNLKVSRSCRMDSEAWKMPKGKAESSWTIIIRDNFRLTHVTAHDHSCKHFRAVIFFTVYLLNMPKLLYPVVKYLFDACRWESLLGDSVSVCWVSSTDFVGTPLRIFKLVYKTHWCCRPQPRQETGWFCIVQWM